MVVADETETEAHLHHGEVNSSLSTHQSLEIHPPKDTASNGDYNHVFPGLGRQSSIYSLTLDEFQHTMCEGGKNFAAMNMDEFLNSIWSAEENQAHNSGQNHLPANSNNVNGSRENATNSLASATSSGNCIETQPSLQRQGSLTLPLPLSRKTVDEVWSEIQRNRQQQMHPNTAVPESTTSSQQRELTLGEMTLEDFLVKAGVVRAPSAPSRPPPPPPPLPQHQQHQYGLYPNANNPHVASTYSARTNLMGMAAGGVPPPYAPMPSNSGILCDPSAKGNNGYPAPPSTTLCYGINRAGNGGASAAAYGQGLALGSPVSPLSSDGLCGPSQVENSASPYGFDVGTLRGRKRPTDGPVEVVVERRQRRMIKNRESAARSRARKQAYTVELEAELNQLREENAQLKQALADLEMQRKQQYPEDEQKMGRTRAQKAMEKLSLMRRGRSCHL